MTRRVTQSDGQTVTSSYGPIRMPVEYRSGMGLQSMFWVPWSLAARLLVPYGLVPSPMFRGRAIAGVGFFAYRDSDLGPYLETGLSIFARSADGDHPFTTLVDQLRPVRRRRSGWAVLDLPVTSERACVVGRECWGLPKFRTSITSQEI